MSANHGGEFFVNVDEPVVLAGNKCSNKAIWMVHGTSEITWWLDQIKHQVMHLFANMCMSFELEIHGQQGDLMCIVQPPGLPCPETGNWFGGMFLTTSNGLCIHPTSRFSRTQYGDICKSHSNYAVWFKTTGCHPGFDNFGSLLTMTSNKKGRMQVCSYRRQAHFCKPPKQQARVRCSWQWRIAQTTTLSLILEFTAKI